MHNSFANLTESSQELLELQTFKETFKSPNVSSWKVAMDEEYISLLKNGTWKLGHCQQGELLFVVNGFSPMAPLNTTRLD
jgi:hypothetical protein